MRLVVSGSRVPKWAGCQDTAAVLRKHTAPGNGCMGRVARPLHEAVRDFGERGCQCAALGDNTVTWTQDENIEQALAQRFKSADLDGNGLIDREEFGHLAETTGAGTECTVFHWLADSTIDEIFVQYAEDEAITYEAFKRLASDGVLLEGRMGEYRALFERAPTFSPGAPSMVGTIDMGELTDLAARLETPLTAQETASLIDQFCCKRECGVAGNERITFEEFLNMFRDHMLDLQQITEYLKLEAAPIPEASPEELEDAAKLIPEDASGVYVITSSEELDAFLKLFPEKVVVLLCGLSWCRPCKSLTRPLEKLAAHYEGSVFLKVMGDTNNNTKRLFKNRLKVKATPHISYFHKGIPAYFRTGANKAKLEAALRRFYNTDKYPLPRTLYPLLKPPAK